MNGTSQPKYIMKSVFSFICIALFVNLTYAAEPISDQSLPRKAAETFLAHAGYSSENIKNLVKDVTSFSQESKGFRAYLLTEPSTDSSVFVAVEQATSEVIGYRGASVRPPLPEQPIPAIVARKNIERFVQTLKPRKKEEKPEFDIVLSDQITKHATYQAKINQRDTTKPGGLEALIEVSASDGRVTFYQKKTHPEIEGAVKNLIRPKTSSEGNLFVKIAPDKSRLAIASKRARPGYPKWWEGRPQGVFLTDAQGKEREEVPVTGVLTSDIFWSPDGKRLAFATSVGAYVYDISSKGVKFLPPPKSPLVESVLRGWLSNDRVLFTWVHNGPGGADLVGWNTEQKEAVLLVKDFNNNVGNDSGSGSFVVSQDGSTLYFSWRVLNDTIAACPYKLYSVPVSNLNEKPKLIYDCLKNQSALTWNEQRISFLENDVRRIVNVKTGELSEFVLPTGVMNLIKEKRALDVQVSVDNSLFVVMPSKNNNQGNFYVINNKNGVITEVQE